MEPLEKVLLKACGSATPDTLPEAAANLILNTLLYNSFIPVGSNRFGVDLETYHWMRTIVHEWPTKLQLEFFAVLIQRLIEFDESLGWHLPLHLRPEQLNPRGRSFWVTIIGDLLGKKLPLSPSVTRDVLSWFAAPDRLDEAYFPINSLVVSLNASVKRGLIIDTEMAGLCVVAAKKITDCNSMAARFIKWSNRLKELAGLRSQEEFPIAAGIGWGWADEILVELRSLPAEKQSGWREILTYCKTGSSSKPAPKWLTAGQKLIQSHVTETEFKSTTARWLTVALDQEISAIDQVNTEVLKGLVWLCALYDDKETARAVGTLGLNSYEKIPNLGPRSIKIGNACIQTLSMMPGKEGLGQLGVMKVKIKFTSAQNTLEKAISAAAERLGMTPDDLMELGVPTYGMTEVGYLTLAAGDFTAELTLPTTKTISVVWRHSSGKLQESVPASVKADFPAVLKELKSTEKELQKMLPAHVERVDQFYLGQKSWPFEAWQERYLHHPLMGVITRRLIWRFSQGETVQDGLWSNGRLIDCHGHTLTIPPEAIVTLWHPLNSLQSEIVAWRSWLEENEIRQPFKQAHREIYLLTPAEEGTEIYSNRFAAHILRQHQFHALATQRGWKNLLQIHHVDCGAYRTHKVLPAWDLRVEFWVEGVPEDVTDAGVYLHLSTDQVRFNQGRVRLADVDPLVFSEIMRDVDLFVGVASLGNDPAWADGGAHGHQGQLNEYWSRYAFGSLSETAQTRKAQLQRLIPRLKIASKCTFLDKFLVVEGKLGKYKIHLGSGNIMMAPDDRYLCIVYKGTPAESVFLPYEGDGMLSVILSKAFLLADDDKIRDSSIMKQIKRG